MPYIQYKNKFFDQLIRKSWWTIIFAFLSFVGYHQISAKKVENIYAYAEKLHSLESEREEKREENKELTLMINSQNDPMWIEMVLMKELGLVPEGKLKVYFTKN